MGWNVPPSSSNSRGSVPNFKEGDPDLLGSSNLHSIRPRPLHGREGSSIRKKTYLYHSQIHLTERKNHIIKAMTAPYCMWKINIKVGTYTYLSSILYWWEFPGWHSTHAHTQTHYSWLDKKHSNEIDSGMEVVRSCLYVTRVLILLHEQPWLNRFDMKSRYLFTWLFCFMRWHC